MSGSNGNNGGGGKLKKKLDAVEKKIIIKALEKASGNMAEAARDLGITERIIGLRVKKYRIDCTKYRT